MTLCDCVGLLIYIRKTALVLLLSMTVAACTQAGDQGRADGVVFSFSVSTPFDSGIYKPASDFARNRAGYIDRALDRNAWVVSGSLGGQALTLTPNADRTEWEVDSVMVFKSDPVLTLQWHYNDLPVADLEKTIDPNADPKVLRIASTDYRTSGDKFDLDRDGLSNLLEIRNDFDPSDNLDPMTSTLGVSIPYIAPESAPEIDGLFEPIWEDGASRDWNGNGLRIDNLMVDKGADRPDGVTEFNWTALHDGEFLYLMVFGEHVDNVSWQSDSRDPWRDDNLDIVIDGDNSKDDSYDKVNDYNWSIPLLDRIKPAAPYANERVLFDEKDHIIRNANGDLAIDLEGVTTFVPAGELKANSNTTTTAPNRIVLNDDSASENVDIHFANCMCTVGQQLWEIRIELSDVDIAVGHVFGIELQLDNDIQGGDREARYGWFHPSRTNDKNTEESQHDPRFAGTAVLSFPTPD